MENNLDNIRTYRHLKSSSLYPFEKYINEKFNIGEEARQLNSEMEHVRPKLKYVTNQEIKKIINNLTDCIDSLKKLLKNNASGYGLSPNQGLMIDNYIYGKIIGVLNSAMNSVSGFPLEDFYYEENSEMNVENVINILDELKNKINSQEFKDYFQLEKLVDTYIEKIHSIWTAANKKLPYLQGF